MNMLTLEGKYELQRRFGKAVLAASWELRHEDGGDVYMVDIMVKPADAERGNGDVMVFTEPLDIFPSDECIANLALVT